MTSRTLDQVLATAWSGVGQWWPNEWWPNGRSTFNDCAAFVSWALYGLNGREPFYTYVPHIMDRAIREGRWHGGRGLVGRPQNSDGAKGMQAGDVVILDWRFRGSRDHVGIALAAPNGGTVRVIQANNGGGGLGNANTRDPAEVVSYSTKYVLGYYRPPYTTTAPAGGGGITITMSWNEDLEHRNPDDPGKVIGKQPARNLLSYAEATISWMRGKVGRAVQILESLDKNINGEGPARRSFDKINGLLQDRKKDDGKPAMLLDENDGDFLRRLISANGDKLGDLAKAVGKIAAPTVTVHIDRETVNEALTDPAVLAALAPAIAREVAAIDRADRLAEHEAAADRLRAAG